MKLFKSEEIVDNVLHISGVSLVDLKEKFKTPLYIMNEEELEKNILDFKNNFKSNKFETEISYASKALSNIYLLKIINCFNLSVDCVSIGEIFTALKAGVNPKKIHFHGNNKTDDELEFALNKNVLNFIIDGKDEIERVEYFAKKHGKIVNALLRINPCIDAHTHEFIKTSKLDSKFGVSIYDNEIFKVLKTLKNSKNINFLGLHAHIGSQIFDKNSFFEEIDTIIDFIIKMEKENISTKVLNIGGGFGVYYTKEDNPFCISLFMKEIIKYIENILEEKDIKSIDKVMIEPGRSIVCTAGKTLYTVGDIKTTPNNKNYIFIDGGMTDNIRPALYDAKYEAMVGNKMNEKKEKVFDIAGKCCESGDIIIKDIELPICKKNDLIVVNSTGAYNYSMASNYNRILKPAMVFVKKGRVSLAVKRESLEDLIKNDVL